MQTKFTSDGRDGLRFRGGAAWHVLFYLLALAGLTLGSYKALGRKYDNEWRLASLAAEQARARLEARDYSREALWGETHAGSAFDAYKEAAILLFGEDPESESHHHRIDAIKQLLEDGRAPAQSFWEVAPAPGADAEQLVKALLSTTRVQRGLDALRRGAHRRDAAPGVDWSSHPYPYGALSGAQVITELLRARAAAELRAGDVEGAMRWILDAVQFGLDLCHSPLVGDQPAGLHLIRRVFLGESWRESQASALSVLPGRGAEMRRLWLAFLPDLVKRVEAISPCVDRWEAEAIPMIAQALEPPRAAAFASFRHRAQLAHIASTCRSAFQSARQHDRWSTAEWEAWSEHWGQRMGEESEALGFADFYALRFVARVRRGVQEELLALVVALHIDLEGADPKYRDTYGRPILPATSPAPPLLRQGGEQRIAPWLEPTER